MYYNFSQLRLGDPKGLPSFFACDSTNRACEHVARIGRFSFPVCVNSSSCLRVTLMI